MKKEPNRKFLPSNVVDSPSRDSSADIGSPFPAAMIRVHATTATVVIATGMLVLVGGWSLGIEPLKGIFPGFPTMKVNTAIGFILCGLSLWLRNRPSPKAHRAAGILGGLVALLGAASLAQYLSGMNFGIDELFFRDAPSAFTSHPGRMSSNTALSFILIGCSLVVLPSAAAVWLAIASLLPVLLSVAGYIYGATAFVGLLSLTGMAFHTIASFLLLVVGVLTTPPMRGLAVWLLSAGPEGTLLRCMMPAAIFIVVGTAIVTQRGFSAGIYTEQSRDALNLFASLVALCGLTLVIARIVARVDFERKQAAQAVSESEQRYRSLYDNNLDPIFSLGHDGRFVSANAAARRLSGYTLEELESLHFLELCTPEQRDTAKDAFRQALCRRCRDLETAIINKSGKRRDLFITGAPVIVDGEIVGVSCIARDITERKKADAMMRSRLRLSELARNATIEELIRCGLDEAESFTGSSIGYFHLVDKDQETLSLQVWSSNTLKTMCSAEGKELHYSISWSGVWADCFRAAGPVIHNDYQNVEYRKGMPEGHPPVVRDLALPILREGRVAAIIGVGNKPSDYTDSDVGVLQDFASLLMDLVASKQAEEQIKRHIEELTRLNLAMSGRELRMIELKREINDLCSRTGLPPRYPLEFEQEQP